MHHPTNNGEANGPVNLLGGVHEKSPADLLGEVNNTDLTSNIVLAAGITFGLMAVLTFGPYLYRKFVPKSEAAPAVVTEEQPETAPTAKADTPAKKTAPPSDDPLATPVPDPLEKGATAAKSTPARDPLLDKLDIGQTKTADPKKNPLDKTDDDLLKDLK